MTKRRYHIRIRVDGEDRRVFPEPPGAMVYFIESDGAAQKLRMCGAVLIDQAVSMAIFYGRLGVDIEWQTSPFEHTDQSQEPHPETMRATTAAGQLFGAGNADGTVYVKRPAKARRV